jgi:hypothetical protein
MPRAQPTRTASCGSPSVGRWVSPVEGGPARAMPRPMVDLCISPSDALLRRPGVRRQNALISGTACCAAVLLLPLQL